MTNIFEILTVLQSLRKTISAAVRKLPGLHQTAVMIWRLVLRSGRCDNYNEGCRIYLLPSKQKQPSEWATTAIRWLCLWFYLLRLSKMPWNLPPPVSSWSSQWLHCMSSGLRERPPEAWSWWHQQGSPAKPPVLLRTHLKADKRKLSVCAIWPPEGLSCTVWCDNSTTYIGEETNTSLRDETVQICANINISWCLLPAIAPAASSCRGPSFPSSSAIFSLLWA